ncbi:MAG TPA: fumarylacetoacetate hydrolase family protein [Actinoplanes sp.]|nr:fumarylacetoacetate hydrolase family protein [Actinoplanes sp.]
MSRLDERIADGMRLQLAARAERLRAGDRPLGWKVGFGAPAAMARLGIDRALVGFLLDSNRLPDGAEVDVRGWATPMLEPEIAVHMGHGLAVTGLSAAIELADVDPPPTGVRAILAGDIFHRHVLLAPARPGDALPDGIRLRLRVNGEQVAATDDVTELTGHPAAVVQQTAELLEACGERLRAGDVVITGSIVPPLPVAPGSRVEVDLGPLGALSVRFPG